MSLIAPNILDRLVSSSVRSRIAFEKPADIAFIYKNRHDIRNEPYFYGSKGYIVWDTNTIYLQFRGTHQFDDILTNIDVRHETVHNFKVHKGFYDKLMSVEHDISRDINSILSNYDIKDIIITGHSSGAGLATIAAGYYGHKFDSYNIICDSFGSPIIGDKEFSIWFSSVCTDNMRIDCEKDIIPTVPISADFVHVPNGYILMKNGSVERYISQKHKNYAEFLKFLLSENLDTIVKEHSIETYINTLMNLIE